MAALLRQSRHRGSQIVSRWSCPLAVIQSVAGDARVRWIADVPEQRLRRAINAHGLWLEGNATTGGNGLMCWTFDDVSKVRCELLAAVGLAQDREFLWQAVFVDEHCGRIARCQQNLELGFQAPGLACQLKAVDAAGHDYVREQKVDPGSLLAN